MKLSKIFLICISALMAFQAAASCQAAKSFDTKYTTIYYNNDQDISDFVWRLGGQKVDFTTESRLASYRVDRVIERVVNILDMRPGRLKINIYLERGELKPNRFAYFEPKTKSIHISVDNTTDGVFAHEVAHAVIDKNFGSALPEKVKEILTQYVDRYLWSDY